MKSFSSILSWLLMAAVLAVPSFLFYNWWSKGKMKASAEVSQAPVSANVFPQDPNAPSPLPPPREEEAPVAAGEPAAAPAQPAPSAAAHAPETPSAQQPVQQEEAGPVLDQPEPEQPPQQEQQAAEATAAEQPAAAEEPAVENSTVPAKISYFSPKGDRDPTLSPEDYRRMDEARRQREEAERMRRLAEAASRRKKTVNPASLISLQGIIGQSAIVNGEMYNVGQRVNGVKIVKIGTNYIIGEYKGKRFRKVMQ